MRGAAIGADCNDPAAGAAVTKKTETSPTKSYRKRARICSQHPLVGPERRVEPHGVVEGRHQLRRRDVTELESSTLSQAASERVQRGCIWRVLLGGI